LHKSNAGIAQLLCKNNAKQGMFRLEGAWHVICFPSCGIAFLQNPHIKKERK